MRIKIRIFLNFLLIAVFSSAIIFAVLFYFGRQIGINTIASYNYLLAQNDMDSVDRYIDRRLERWQSYVASNVDLWNALHQSNDQFAKMTDRDAFINAQDAAWQATEKEVITPFMKGIIDSSLSDGLRLRAGFYEQRGGYKVFPEFFVTNKYGALVASMGKTSDYLQSDEAWWEKTVREGSFVQDVSLDESTGIQSLAFCIRIDDAQGKFVGVAKIVYDMRDVFGVADSVVKSSDDTIDRLIDFSRKTVVARLFNSEGKLIYSTKDGFGYLADSPQFSSVLEDAAVVGGKPYSLVKNQGVEKLFSHGHSHGSGVFKGLGWLLVVEKDAQEALAPLNRLVLYLFFAVLLALILVVITATLLSYSFNRPIRLLMQAVQRVQAGDLNVKITQFTHDEIGELAKAFSSSVEAVKKSRQEVDRKVAEQTAEIQQKAGALADQQQATLNLLQDVEKEKEEATHERDKVDTILHSIGDGVLVVDNQYRVTVFNNIAEKISGISAQAILGNPYDAFLKFVSEKDEKISDTFVRDAIETGVMKKMANHTVLIHPDGRRIPVADSAAPLKDAQGHVLGCVVVFRDVTREREIDRAKSEFVSVASHQLRTPLTGIKWFSELLLKDKLSPKIKDYINQIYVSNERMVRLVDDLLNVSRIDTGRKFDIVLKEQDIVPIIKSTIEEQIPYAAAKKISLVCSPLAPKELVMSVDDLKIRQVFQNLVSNAVKYSKEGGRVDIGCEEKPEEVIFSVKDSGIGIPPAQQKRVFEKFFRAENALTAHTDGTGLGLYIAKAIMEGHQGRIWFESKEGEGSTFFVALPRKVVLKTPAELVKKD